MRPEASEQLDYEGDVAIVIGAPGRRIAVERTPNHTAGYMPDNDASARDWQHLSAQCTPGKNFAGTGACGPWTTTPDELGDPGSMTVTTRLDDEVFQRGSLSELIFPIPELISYISTFTELRARDVLVTGTPEGVGASRDPHRFL